MSNAIEAPASDAPNYEAFLGSTKVIPEGQETAPTSPMQITDASSLHKLLEESSAETVSEVFGGISFPWNSLINEEVSASVQEIRDSGAQFSLLPDMIIAALRKRLPAVDGFFKASKRAANYAEIIAVGRMFCLFSVEGISGGYTLNHRTLPEDHNGPLPEGELEWLKGWALKINGGLLNSVKAIMGNAQHITSLSPRGLKTLNEILSLHQGHQSMPEGVARPDVGPNARAIVIKGRREELDNDPSVKSAIEEFTDNADGECDCPNCRRNARIRHSMHASILFSFAHSVWWLKEEAERNGVSWRLQVLTNLMDALVQQAEKLHPSLAELDHVESLLITLAGGNEFLISGEPNMPGFRDMVLEKDGPLGDITEEEKASRFRQKLESVEEIRTTMFQGLMMCFARYLKDNGSPSEDADNYSFRSAVHAMPWQLGELQLNVPRETAHAVFRKILQSRMNTQDTDTGDGMAKLGLLLMAIGALMKDNERMLTGDYSMFQGTELEAMFDAPVAAHVGDEGYEQLKEEAQRLLDTKTVGLLLPDSVRPYASQVNAWGLALLQAFVFQHIDSLKSDGEDEDTSQAKEQLLFFVDAVRPESAE